MFEIGDIVKVVANTNIHRFPLGAIVRIIAIDDDVKQLYDDGKDYKCEYLDGSDFWFLGSNEFEKVENNGI